METEGDLTVTAFGKSQEAGDCLHEQPDVILLCLSPGGERPDAFLNLVRQAGLPKRLIVFGEWLSAMERRRLMRFGVGGVLSERCHLFELLEALRSVAAGGTWFEKHMRPDPPQDDDWSGRLSEQERRVANLVLSGLTNKEIGIQMSISESYVKGILQRVFLKLGARSRAQLFRLAWPRGSRSRVGRTRTAHPPSEHQPVPPG